MISLNNDVWTPSEGRGHRFESCRVRHMPGLTAQLAALAGFGDLSGVLATDRPRAWARAVEYR